MRPIHAAVAERSLCAKSGALNRQFPVSQISVELGRRAERAYDHDDRLQIARRRRILDLDDYSLTTRASS